MEGSHCPDGFARLDDIHYLSAFAEHRQYASLERMGIRKARVRALSEGEVRVHDGHF